MITKKDLEGVFDLGIKNEGYKKMFPNGFDSWQETHFEVVKGIANSEDTPGSTAHQVIEFIGTGGLYDLAKELTNKFENTYVDIDWGVDLIYQDVMEKFLDKEL